MRRRTSLGCITLWGATKSEVSSFHKFLLKRISCLLLNQLVQPFSFLSGHCYQISPSTEPLSLSFHFIIIDHHLTASRIQRQLLCSLISKQCRREEKEISEHCICSLNLHFKDAFMKNIQRVYFQWKKPQEGYFNERKKKVTLINQFQFNERTSPLVTTFVCACFFFITPN